MIRPGQVFLADFGEAGPHPFVVVSRESLNRGHYLVGVVCTSTRFERRKQLAHCVPILAGQFGFTRDCVIQCENILSIHRDSLTSTEPIGEVDEFTFRSVVKAIGYVIESECEPD